MALGISSRPGGVYFVKKGEFFVCDFRLIRTVPTYTLLKEAFMGEKAK
jgi:hypothetical protein